MRIVVDTDNDITQLFKTISEKIRKTDKTSECILDNVIVISSKNLQIRECLSEIIAEYVQSKYEQKLIYGYIKAFEFLKSENDEIVKAIIDDDKLKKKHFDILKKEVMSHILKGKVNIDGLVKFRLTEYKNELLFATEYFADEHSAKKSYDEFIGLMKYFTEIQSPVTETVVITENSGEYRLTDADGKPINLKFDEEFADEIMPLGLTGEDLLISNLMAAMPRKIVLENVNKDKPIINTISRIFEGRISY